MKVNAPPAKRVCCLAVGLLCLVLALPALAQPLPGGDYQRTCSNINMRGNVLNAMCRRQDGTVIWSELRDAHNCRGSIANINGQLTCQNPYNLPNGNYQQSCRNMFMEGNDLVAICTRMNGSTIATRLANARACRGNISNRDGSLVCEMTPIPEPLPMPGLQPPPQNQQPSPGILPGGSYLRNCTNARMQGSTLIADCPTNNGIYQRTQLQNAMSCAGDISNDNGVLLCTNVSTARPQGNFESTCREISIVGNRMSALCRNQQGAWQSTSVAFGPNSFISNCGGTLMDTRTCPRTSVDPLEQLVQQGMDRLLDNLFGR